MAEPCHKKACIRLPFGKAFQNVIFQCKYGTLFSKIWKKVVKFSSRRPKGHDIPLMRANFRLAKGELA